MFWNQDTILRVVRSDDSQLKHLAAIAGISLEDALKLGDWSGIDLRNQDLTGLNMEAVDLSSAVIDESTKIDDERVLSGGKENLEERFKFAVEYAFDMPNPRKEGRRIVNAISRRAKFLFYIGSYDRFRLNLCPDIDNESNIFSYVLKRGYYNSEFIFIDHFNYQPISVSVLGNLTSNFPEVANADGDLSEVKRQLELPFSEFQKLTEKSPDRSISMNRWVRLLRANLKISDVWIIINTFDIDDDVMDQLQSEVGRLIKSKTLFKFVFVCQDRAVLDSGWRKSLMRDGDVFLAQSDADGQSALDGYLSSISYYMSQSVVFSREFGKRLASEFIEWDAASPIVRAVGLKAISRTRKMPVRMGLPELRANIPPPI